MLTRREALVAMAGAVLMPISCEKPLTIPTGIGTYRPAGRWGIKHEEGCGNGPRGRKLSESVLSCGCFCACYEGQWEWISCPTHLKIIPHDTWYFTSGDLDHW